jgi:F-type H+-transporting ATPase subunit beta
MAFNAPCFPVAGAGGKSETPPGAGAAKAVLPTEMIHIMIGHQDGLNSFCGIGDSCREFEQE